MEEKIVAALRYALLTDSNSRVRAECAKTLGKIGSESAVPELSNALLNDSSDSVRFESARALERIARRGLPPTWLAWVEVLLKTRESLMIQGSPTTSEAVESAATNSLERLPRSVKRLLLAMGEEIQDNLIQSLPFPLNIVAGVVGST